MHLKTRLTGFLLALALSSVVHSAPEAKITDEGLHMRSGFLDVTLAADRPAVVGLSVDGLGKGKLGKNLLRPPASVGKFEVERTGEAGFAYRAAAGNKPAWTIEVADAGITFTSEWSKGEAAGPLTFDIPQANCYATLLGLLDADGKMNLPAALHLPARGTIRIAAEPGDGAALPYQSADGVVHFELPAATEQRPKIVYAWAVTAAHPKLEASDADPRLDTVKRSWLNVMQLNPARGALSNHTNSDTCAFCYYEYSDIARQAPELGKGVVALDVMRQTLDTILAGTKAYGMPGYHMGAYPEYSADTYPSLLIAASNCASDERGAAWAEKNYAGIKGWADALLKTDKNGNGLVEYVATGNSNSWDLKQVKIRPSNWWDTIGFGHEDAYANALAYRGLRGVAELAKTLKHDDDAARFTAAADKLHAAYYDTFFNPKTGVLAGWKSADGELHDYYFTFVNGIAIRYGLVSPEQGNAIMDKLLAKMKDVGYGRFELGLPGNLVSVLKKDYVHHEVRFGGGEKEDNSDGFQIYENGGATACYAYFTLAALYELDRIEDADRIFFPMLAAVERGEFEGIVNGKSNDWRMWDGTPTGYEGYLTDNYYMLNAALDRDEALRRRAKK